MDVCDAIEIKLAEIYDAIKNNCAESPNYGLLSGLGERRYFYTIMKNITEMSITTLVFQPWII